MLRTGRTDSGDTIGPPIENGGGINLIYLYYLNTPPGKKLCFTQKYLSYFSVQKPLQYYDIRTDLVGKQF